MNLDLTKTSHQLLLGVIIVFLATMSWMQWSSPEIREAEKFLRANSQIQNALGDVRRVSLKSRGSYNEKNGEHKLKFYRFHVGGTKSRALVEVACRPSKDGPDSCTIETVD